MGEETKDANGPHGSTGEVRQLHAVPNTAQMATADRWAPKVRRRLHDRLNIMMNAGDRVMLLGIGRNEGSTLWMLEKDVALFPATTPLEMLGMLVRTQHDFLQELDAGAEVVNEADLPQVSPALSEAAGTLEQLASAPSFTVEATDTDGVGKPPNMFFVIMTSERIEADPPGAYILITKCGDRESRIRIYDTSTWQKLQTSQLVLDLKLQHLEEPAHVAWHNEAVYAAEVAASYYWSMWRREAARRRAVRPLAATDLKAEAEQ